MQVEGIRVVRGPDWTGDDDGGEGYVGTVTQDNEDDTVEVQWDMGNSDTYSTGSCGKYHIRVLDSAPLGLEHNGIRCDVCNELNFPGTRWKCCTCDDFDLCTPCYFGDKHDKTHGFLRYDAPGMPGETVAKRSTSRKVRSQGIFKGATVERGADWNALNQDGGPGNKGTVVDMVNYGTDGRQRDAVQVKWPKTSSNTYKLGYKGKVDLQCVKPATGFVYYPDHLVPLYTTGLPKKRSIHQKPPVPQRMSSVKQRKPLPPEPIQEGDKVFVEFGEDALKTAQKGHGGWSMRMKDYIGKVGQVRGFNENGDCIIDYDDDKQWTFNPEAIKKVSNVTLKVGDIVRVIDDEDKCKMLQKRQGWQSEMKAALGKVGKVVKIDSDGDVAVAFGNKAWVYNPLCLEPAPGARVFIMQEDKPDAGGAGAADSDSDNDSDGVDVGGLLGQAIAQMLLVHGLGQLETQKFVSAASNNDVSTIKAMLKRNAALVDEKFKGLTALIIASHEGHLPVVRELLTAGADKDVTESKGNTALMAALMKNRETIAMALIDAGANLNLSNNQGRTAVHFCAANGGNTVLKELLRRRADPNKQDIAGDTALHDAILQKNQVAVVILLSDSRTNQKLLNKKALCPLHLAAMKDDARSVERLLVNVPRLVNAPKDDGFCAIHIAALNDNCDVLRVLIKHKVDVNRGNKDSLTALHLACHQGYKEAVSVLLEASADVDAKDEDGDTPLHVTFMGSRRNDSTQVLAQLMGLRITNEAEIKDRTSIACLLIEQGADVQARNKKGRTALQCCSNDRMRNAVEMFIRRQRGSAGTARRTGGATLADLFSGLPLPCAVCMEKMSGAIFKPCGHKICCERCSFRVRECPLCDQRIEERYDLAGRRMVLDPCKVQ